MKAADQFMELTKRAIPKDKYDVESLKSLRGLDIGQIKLILPLLMEWLQDINWPVAPPLSKALADYGIVLLPFFRLVLNSGDPQWQFSVMHSLIRELPKDISIHLKEDLLRIVLQPTQGELLEELNILAKETIDYIEVL
ncbi:DUF5071 domain-containing protein [Paenibacillus sp. MWE-103]|uniref:DUF5071 domain-containing protein n=1 Tax=Paenibacillus artemisiicola TaxID=1172618 RepID=A0ABS3WEI1_9BACL|nr:DUF5071 domain-containing protein [Paenibacillus artemisiicola]MBO7746717.1 DUF5071 domain-containing protein [Paenibacillus artemisiicola]